MLKTVFGNNLKKVFLVLLAALFFMASGFFIELPAFAAVAVIPALGGSAISADSAGGSYTALTGPVISESVSGDIGKGTVVLNAPSGFLFDTGGTAPTIRVDCIGGCLNNTHNINNTKSGDSVPVSSVTATQITKNIAQTTNSGVTNSLTWQNVRVRPASGTPLAGGNITKSGTSVISGVNGTTNFGTLAEIAGVLASIVVSPDTATIDVDHIQTFTAEGFDSSHNTLGDITSITAFSIAEAPADGGNFSGAAYHPHIAGTYHARGTDGAFTDTTVSLIVVPGAVSASQSTVSANPETQIADGSSLITVTVTARDQFGNPVPVQSVILSASGSQNIFVQPAPTDASGQTTGTLASTEAEAKTISATVNGTTVTQTAPVIFSAIPVVTHAITASAGPHGSISPSGIVLMNDGADQIFTITPDAHYHIVDITADGVSVGATTSYMFTSIKTDHTISATFAMTIHALSYAAGTHGSLTGTSSQIVNDGDSGTAVTAVADVGYHFENWSDGLIANPRTDANVTGNISVTALFALNPDTVPPVISLNGSATTSIALGNVFVDLGATAVDDVDGIVTPVVSGTIDANTPGIYALIYTATDLHGNASSKMRTVIVSGTSLAVVTVLNGDGTQSGTLTNAATSTISTSAGIMAVAVPANLAVTGPSDWDGTIYLPTATTTFVAPTPDSGNTADAIVSIEIGFGDVPLTFDKAVKISFAGQVGKLVGWSQAGAFHQITTICGGTEDQAWANANLATGQDCKFDFGSDLVIWTKHFTVFSVYTQSAIPQSGGGSGGGSNSGGDNNGDGDSGGGILVQNTSSVSDGGTNSAASVALLTASVIAPALSSAITPSPAVAEHEKRAGESLSRANQERIAKIATAEQKVTTETGTSAGNVTTQQQNAFLLAAIGAGITLGTDNMIIGLIVLLTLFSGGAFLVWKRFFM